MHNLQENDSQHGLSQAWHGLTVVPESGVLERDEVFPYEVYQDPLMRNGKPHFDIFTPVCTDTNEPIGDGPCLSSKSYTLFTPKDTWNLLDEMIAGTDHRFVSAGTVGNRSRFFLTIELDGLESIEAGGRKFEFFLNAISSLDTSLKLVFTNTSTCTVCENTLLANFFAKSWFKHSFKHTKNMPDAIEAFKKVLDETFGMPALFKQAMDGFADVPVNDELATNLFTGALASKDAEKNISKHMVTRLNNSVDEHMETFYAGRGNNGENLLDVVSAYTELRSRTDEKDPNKVGRVIGSEFDLSSLGSNPRKAEFARTLVDEDSRSMLAKRGKELQKLI